MALDEYTRLALSEPAPSLELCPCCGAAPELWQHIDPKTSNCTKVVMCSNGTKFGPQDGIANEGCPLYMPSDGHYMPTIREAVKYWNDFAKALGAMQRRNRWAAHRVIRGEQATAEPKSGVGADEAMEAIEKIVGEDTDVLLSDEGQTRVYTVLEQLADTAPTGTQAAQPPRKASELGIEQAVSRLRAQIAWLRHGKLGDTAPMMAVGDMEVLLSAVTNRYGGEWRWMTHPNWNNGDPIPVRVFEQEGQMCYQPFDVEAIDFDWDKRDAEWVEVPAPSPHDPTEAVLVYAALNEGWQVEQRPPALRNPANGGRMKWRAVPPAHYQTPGAFFGPTPSAALAAARKAIAEADRG